MVKIHAALVLTLSLPALALPALGADYPIVYVRTPRYGDGSKPGDRIVNIPEAAHPMRFAPGSDLVLRNPDGSEVVLVEAGHGAVCDPYVSFDGKVVYYAYCPDARGKPWETGQADVWKIDLATRKKTRLTHQERTPASGWGRAWKAEEAVFNLGPCPLPGGRVAFTSTRNMLIPVGQVFGCHQLFVMDQDGKNVTQVGHLNLGSALHPTILTDGRIMWSSSETQGRRDRRMWGLWASYPDGRKWGPLMSALHGATIFHFHTQRKTGDIVVSKYYISAMNGLGELFGFTTTEGPLSTSRVEFLSPDARDNPRVGHRRMRFPFQPKGMYSVTPFATGFDAPAKEGRVSHPSEAPNGMLVTYSPGPAHDKGSPKNQPYYDMGIYLIKGKVAATPADLVEVVNSPEYNENQSRAVVPYKDIYGIDEPREIPFLPHDSGYALLPKGTPFGLVGTSGVYARESHTPRQGKPEDANFRYQGGDAFPPGTGKFDSSLIHAMRILVQEPTTRLGYRRDFRAVGDERLRILGEVPLRKFDAEGKPILDPAGDPDTSFLARIPADVAFTFQLIDKEGVALTTAQTWHQVRPGEARYDCRGCHAHHNPGIEFEGTAASKPSYRIPDLTGNEPRTVEYHRDVEPILKKSCLGCHGKKDAPKGAVFSAKTLLHSASGSKWARGYAARMSPLYTKPRDGLMPPPDSGVAAPTKEEILTIARWIDLGMPIDEPTSRYRNGVFADDQKPTLALESPRRDEAADRIRFGAFDFSGIKRVSVKASFWVNGRKPGAELFDLFGPAKDSVYTLDLGATVRSGVVTVTVTDGGGHRQTDERTFSDKSTARAGR